MANAVISGGGVEMQLKYGANIMLVTVYVNMMDVTSTDPKLKDPFFVT